jgi:hypothetical protein
MGISTPPSRLLENKKTRRRSLFRFPMAGYQTRLRRGKTIPRVTNPSHTGHVSVVNLVGQNNFKLGS